MEFLNLPATIEYCEKAGNWLIARPFYAVSNFAYGFAAVAILVKGRGSRLSQIFAGLLLFIASMSFAYDTKDNFVTQLLDLFAIYIFLHTLIFLNLKNKIAARKLIIFQILVIVGAMAAIVLFRGYTGTLIIGGFVLAVLASQPELIRNPAMALLTVGTIFWLLDVNKIYCDPRQIFNGRGAFHLLTAGSIYHLYSFYESNIIKLRI
ncbi:MAG: hypothetical protein A3J07_04100 [Candidatus Doudnabacteria bacterium RIFCSPLOWO2_02_FULL_49_13]|uniref:Uncharacterized protein n=1 Tax=Candidatus Doudnabacteria bacterium RIFCSPHIGHO2_12_FULL_48_16 TaxID=1817838 RepID=A0A1F5PJQ5_9BACT|nr:MAG: hypothetical protein A3B77_02905 [Candidatus Doudnabacteria bacterium RIFCSPHIGHO2_02_FULL_49_24]OGE89234.1 MAG: hypothetical protein A2760_04485 [Candidatus Doudnabacteria bacterium RIFCSPHIGHO2_01_FULL_50_67]OGE90097.1 MAG: hypothetical protein A3E29_03240 [Candidatus Doudnabacteria bacterium RIFCSPHIGHO2_12_FULL_48_16]OGE97128.1 MAG: hypothetical protein A2990_00950 [Candidatus Doudnabacteria bacterium RIFCSPLOWO2_01_FULL_49_40]OGF03240.1 MAG: hypothetical protein A3J07_04100 [Candid